MFYSFISDLNIYNLPRFQGTDIVTIREAAWLTDGTYKYEEVVRLVLQYCYLRRFSNNTSGNEGSINNVNPLTPKISLGIFLTV